MIGSKPDPEPYLGGRLGVPADEVMLLDDTRECVDGTTHVGMAAVLVKPLDKTPAFDLARELLGLAWTRSVWSALAPTADLGPEAGPPLHRRRRRACGRAAAVLGEATESPPSRVACWSSTSPRRRRSTASPVGSAPTPSTSSSTTLRVDARALGVSDDDRDVLRLDEATLLDEIRINAIGPMLLVRALVDQLRRARHRRVSSTCHRPSGQWGWPRPSGVTSATWCRKRRWSADRGGALRRSPDRRQRVRRRPPARAAAHGPRHATWRARGPGAGQRRDRRPRRSSDARRSPTASSAGTAPCTRGSGQCGTRPPLTTIVCPEHEDEVVREQVAERAERGVETT